MQPKNMQRLMRALSRECLDIQFNSNTYSVRLQDEPDAPIAEVLMPSDFVVEAKAFKQLANLAAVRHPGGGCVCRACATPDFHPGNSGVAIGSVVETEGQVIPAAIGTDINCGMRLHVADLSVERFLANRDRFVEAMKGDYFFGTRDVTMQAKATRALYSHGIPGWLDAMIDAPMGSVAHSDFDQLAKEADRVYLGGSMAGHWRWAPEELVPESGLVRDGEMATVGGGNHFVEVQTVEAVMDRQAAFQLGVKEGQLAFMIHSGSRHVGQYIGGMWRDYARKAWPTGLKYPTAQLFPLSVQANPELVRDYLEAEATAANYAFVNRLLLAELLRLRLREVFGDIEAPLVYDLPHNITLPEGSGWVIRKGACPAFAGQPVIIPGSMGTSSYLLMGQGNDHLLNSASHGAGRSKSRFEMTRAGADHQEEAMGLTGVDCVALRSERRLEEAPAAYKPIQPVIDAQVAAGSVQVVARLRPLLTFKV